MANTNGGTIVNAVNIARPRTFFLIHKASAIKSDKLKLTAKKDVTNAKNENVPNANAKNANPNCVCNTEVIADKGCAPAPIAAMLFSPDGGNTPNIINCQIK